MVGSKLPNALVLLSALLLPASFTAAAWGATGEASPAAAAEAESARRLKDVGDGYALQDKAAEAADAFQQALRLDPDAFSLDERVRMATWISWDNRLQSAIEQLQRVLQKDPGHLAARIQLARVYSWQGDLARSIAEANQALRISEGNEEALLIKADALEWQGHFKQAIPIYRSVLDRGTRFDARLGLAYALLSAGDQAAAGESARGLSAASVRESKQLSKLTDAIEDAVRPKVDVRYNQYADSDHNQADRYSLLYGFALGNQNFAMTLKRTDAESQTGKTRAEDASIVMSSSLTEGVRLTAGAGVSRPGAAAGQTFGTGQFGIDAAVSNATIGAVVETAMLTDTVELINNRVRATTYGGHLSKPWGQRLSTYAGLGYQTFSDGNRAESVQLTPQYVLSFAPRIAIGYRFRFLDFREQSGSGFFDPHNYISHRAFTSFSVERKRISAYVDVFGGKQQFIRNGASTNDWVMGGSASIGFRPIRHFTIEVNGEGGNFDAASVAGFKYWTAGSRLLLRF